MPARACHARRWTARSRLDPKVRLAPDQQRRLGAALALADPQSWRQFVSSQLEAIVGSVCRGELPLEQAIDLVDRMSIGCLHATRIELLGQLAYLAQRVPRTTLQTRLPDYPQCIRTGTGEWVLAVKAHAPALRLTAGAVNRDAHDPSSPVIERVPRWLSEMKVQRLQRIQIEGHRRRVRQPAPYVTGHVLRPTQNLHVPHCW
jgi:hypothetical protein